MRQSAISPLKVVIAVLPWALAISARLAIGKMANLIVPYPTLGEISKRAAGSYYAPSLFSPRTRKFVKLVQHLP